LFHLPKKANVRVDATNKSNDLGQRWQAGQPNATNDWDGGAVILTKNGWDDVPSNTTVDTLICSTPNFYELNPNGRWYRPNYDPQYATAFANNTCIKEGGYLMQPFGPTAANVTRLYYTKIGKPYYRVDGRKLPNYLGVDWYFMTGNICIGIVGRLQSRHATGSCW
jgi:hypothetical protein